MCKGSTLNYLHQDHLTGTSLTTNSNGTAVGTIKYLPFGTTRSTTGTLGTDKRFTGQRLDSTGLYYYGTRYYSPHLGRFISPDPITHSEPLPVGQVIKGLTVYRTTSQFSADQTRTPATINPQEHNRYSYALNNPLRYTDPDGHQALAGAEYVVLGLYGLGLIGYYYFILAPALERQGVDTGINSALSYAGNKMKGVLGAVGGFLNNLNPFKKNEPQKGSNNNLPQKNINISEKISGQMEQRGWNGQSIQKAVDDPYTTRQSIDMRTGQPSTAYYPEAGSRQYVVRNDVTGDIIQISNRNIPNWTPDLRIIGPYLP
jgi:RHS repeat-associated protein